MNTEDTFVELPFVSKSPFRTKIKALSIPWHITEAGIPEHWDWSDRGEGVLVGIADTGIDEDHPDIAGRVDHAKAFHRSHVAGKPDYYDGNDHGTHVATTIAVGAPKCRFAIAKVLKDNGSGSNRKVAQGIRWLADAGCHVINVSLGGSYDDPETRAAVLYAKSKGCHVIIATGNEAASAVGYPAQHGVGVGAVDRGRKLAYFSNRGKKVDLVGYGVDIKAGVPGGGWQEFSGTSMATPNVVIAVVLRLAAEYKHLGKIITNSDEMLLKLETFVTDLGPEGKDTSYGRGMVDMKTALYSGLEDTSPSDPGNSPLLVRIEDPANEVVHAGTVPRERVGPG